MMMFDGITVPYPVWALPAHPHEESSGKTSDEFQLQLWSMDIDLPNMRLRVSDPCKFVSKLRMGLHFLGVERLGKGGSNSYNGSVSPILRHHQV